MTEKMREIVEELSAYGHRELLRDAELLERLLDGRIPQFPGVQGIHVQESAEETLKTASDRGMERFALGEALGQGAPLDPARLEEFKEAATSRNLHPLTLTGYVVGVGQRDPELGKAMAAELDLSEARFAAVEPQVYGQVVQRWLEANPSQGGRDTLEALAAQLPSGYREALKDALEATAPEAKGPDYGMGL